MRHTFCILTSYYVVAAERRGEEDSELTGGAVAGGAGPLVTGRRLTAQCPRVGAGVTAHLDDVRRHGYDVSCGRRRRVSASEHCHTTHTHTHTHTPPIHSLLAPCMHVMHMHRAHLIGFPWRNLPKKFT